MSLEVPGIGGSTEAMARWCLDWIQTCHRFIPGPWEAGEDNQIRGPVEEGPHVDHVVECMVDNVVERMFECTPRRRVLMTTYGLDVSALVITLQTIGPRAAESLVVAVACLERLLIGGCSQNGRGRITHALGRIRSILRGDP